MSGTEARAALRNLVLMISSLCACGFSELRPTRANTELFKLQGFVLPQPSTPGQAVRNVQAFQVCITRKIAIQRQTYMEEDYQKDQITKIIKTFFIMSGDYAHDKSNSEKNFV